MHAIATSVTGPDADGDFMHELCFNTFNRLLTYAKEYGVGIAMETMVDAQFTAAATFLESFPNSKKPLTEFQATVTTRNSFLLY